jgi:hypothetical protein
MWHPFIDCRARLTLRHLRVSLPLLRFPRVGVLPWPSPIENPVIAILD